jgi:hypothetical protein
LCVGGNPGEKQFTRAERLRSQAFGTEEPPQRTTNRIVVVHDVNFMRVVLHRRLQDTEVLNGRRVEERRAEGLLDLGPISALA